MYNRRNRILLGNVSLMLFLAFLFMLNPYTLQKAEAAPAVILPNQVTVNSSRQVTLPLTITPLSASFAGTVRVTLQFRDKDHRSAGTGQFEQTVSSVYEDAYKILLSVVYQVPSVFTSGTRLTPSLGSVTYGGTIQVVVYLDEIAEPPEDGGGGGAVTPEGTTGTDTGWQKYVPSEDKATVHVDPKKTQSMFDAQPAAGVTLINIKPVAQTGQPPKNVTADLPVDVLKQAGVAKVDSVLKLGTLDVAISPKVMQAISDAVKSAGGSMANLEIRAVKSDKAATDSTLAAVGGDAVKLMTPASEIVTLSFHAVAPNGQTTEISLSEMQVSIPFDLTKVGNVDNVNLYRIGSLIYVGGKVENGKVSGKIAQASGGRFVALEYSKKFADVAGHWAQRDVELMASKYVIEGTSDTTFEPARPVTRAEFVTMLTRSLGLSQKSSTASTFSDVAPGAWYHGFVEAAFSAGLTKGDSGTGGKFRPTDSITREEMAALMVRAMKLAGKEAKALTSENVAAALKAFADGSQIASWAGYEAAQAVNEGIIKGRDGATFAPKVNGSRAEAATMMSRFMKQVGIL